MSNTSLTTARWHLTNKGEFPWNDDVSSAVLDLISEKLGFAPPSYRPIPIAPLPPADSPQVIALCLGHGRAGDEGNVGAGGVSEEDYNLEILERVAALLRKAGVKVIPVTYYEGSGYTKAMEWLAAKLKREGATAAVEFHFNATNKKARGHEVLHWKNSVRGVTLAKSLLDSMDHYFPDQPSRGLKPRVSTERGALFCSLLHCPSVISEPFFGDQAADWKLFSSEEGKERLVTAITDGIHNWIQSQPAAA
jgi:N-acetylmuramoyl-L-alanine amidase